MFVFKSAEFINTSLITDAIKIGKSIQNLAYPVIGPYVYKTNLPLTSDALDNTQTLIWPETPNYYTELLTLENGQDVPTRHVAIKKHVCPN